MNTVKFPNFNPLQSPSDRLLAEIAINIQLPPSLHKKACERFDAIHNYLDNRESDIKGKIRILYPQGSMSIDATISTRGTDDEFDLDLVAEFPEEFKNWSPCKLLDELFKALKDYPVKEVKRQTRCVTLYYSDNMHVDVTPSVRSKFSPEKQSVIAHAKGPFQSQDDHWVAMNAFGFAYWYNERTPDEERITAAMVESWNSRQGMVVLSEAEKQDLPEQSDFVTKSTTTLALQLLKRYRNTRYADATGRIPPSVLLACFAGQCATQNLTLTDMMLRLANHIKDAIERAEMYNELLDVENPIYSDDKFTDRWPENYQQQGEFLLHIKDLIRGLEKIKRREFPVDELASWLKQNFGDGVVSRANLAIAKRNGEGIQGAKQTYTSKGGIIMPTAAAVVTAPSIVKAAPHTFYGDAPK